jgi:hypothetical protein
MPSISGSRGAGIPQGQSEELTTISESPSSFPKSFELNEEEQQQLQQETEEEELKVAEEEKAAREHMACIMAKGRWVNFPVRDYMSTSGRRLMFSLKVGRIDLFFVAEAIS